jgi:crotonobetainyl-CoA:carnitine CoA-transferase CaiB-like acyl-CoA transferase
MITHQPVNNHEDLLKVVDGILGEAGLDRNDTGGKVTFAGLDPIRPTVLKVGAASAIVAAANSIASAIIWKMRGGEGQDIHVDLRNAYVIQSCWQDVLADCTTINGVSVMSGQNLTIPPSLFPTKDDRWMVISSPYPASFHKVLNVLNCGMDLDQIRQATRKWNAAELEAACQNAGTPVVMVRTQDEYRAEEQYEHHAGTPLVKIEKIGDSDPEPLGPAERPLSGIRALGMVHVVAGPSILRELAHHGADSLNLNTPDWLELPYIYYNCDAGTRQAFLDARIDKNRPKVYSLVKDADIFVENLRPGRIDAEGYSAQELAAYRPGIIYVSVKVCASTGPWSNWLGFDQNAGAVSGLLTEEGTKDRPLFPHGPNVICDFLTGYLATMGAKAALIRRAQEGGSYKVTVTLTQTAMYMLSLGLIDKNMLLDLDSLGEEHQRLEPNLQSGQTPLGDYTRLGSQVEMSKTPEYWADPMIWPIGSCKPEWLPR